jgi:transposase InsO family protein
VLANEQATTCAGFLLRAGAFFAAHGITIQRVMTDNAAAYRRGRAFQQAVAALGASQRFTAAYRPQSNGKVERFNRTLLAAWAYVRAYTSNTERTAALDTWLHLYNHHRAHTALGGLPPISRVHTPPGSYS